jgi:hypothetical protein
MSGGGFLYLYRTYTSTVSGSRQKRETCIGCSCSFEYKITRVAQGGGHSGFYLNNRGAAASADTRARANLVRALDEAIEPVHCPTCGIYQPDMVQALRERHGKRFDPNKYAAERIKFPAASLWRSACEINTKEAYNRFTEVWPTLDWHAKKQIKELRYPPHVRKLVSSIGWMLWGALALCAIGLVLAGILASR